MNIFVAFKEMTNQPMLNDVWWQWNSFAHFMTLILEDVLLDSREMWIMTINLREFQQLI